MSDPINIYIVDDESLARERLKRMLESAEGYHICGEASNGEQAIQNIPSARPDIVLLDIRMPGIDGLEVAQHLNSMNETPAIIFCTAYDQYAIEAFKYQAIGYLLKPARQEDLLKALESAKQLNQLQLKQLAKLGASHHNHDSFVANTWQGQEVIALNDIYYFRADQKYLTVIHTGGETISDQTLKDLEQKYQDTFIRAHRNSLVNTKHLDRLIKDGEGHHFISLKGCTENIPVSRRHVNDIKEYLAKL